MTFEYDAFLSYSSKDKTIVHALAECLKQDGLRVWLDEWAIQPGDLIPLKIHEGLEKSHILLMCMSPAYFESEWGLMEYNILIFRDPRNKERRLIPLLIADCIRPDFIAPIAYIDWRIPSNKAYRKILALCQEKQGEEAKNYGILLENMGRRKEDGRQFAYLTQVMNNTIAVLNIVSNTVIATVPVGDRPLGVAVSPEGTKVYVVNGLSNNVSVINAFTNTVTTSVTVENPFAVVITPDGNYAYVTSAENIVSVINTLTDIITATIRVGNRPFGVAVSPDGKKVYVANYGSNTVSVIDTATNTVLTAINVGNCPYGISVATDGTKVYVANSVSTSATGGGKNAIGNNGPGSVTVIDTATNTVIAMVEVGVMPTEVAVTPDSKKVYVSNLASNTVSVIDTATNTVSATVPVGSSPYGIEVAPDGTRTYVVGSPVSIIDVATNKVIGSIDVKSVYGTFGHFIGPLLKHRL
ncbi:MAG TPA: TIR domain-containing protein [Methanosarcina sp.]|jgi:YVTN family beta-propeller protein